MFSFHKSIICGLHMHDKDSIIFSDFQFWKCHEWLGPDEAQQDLPVRLTDDTRDFPAERDGTLARM